MCRPTKPYLISALVLTLIIALVAKAPAIASAYQELFLLDGMLMSICL